MKVNNNKGTLVNTSNRINKPDKDNKKIPKRNSISDSKIIDSKFSKNNVNKNLSFVSTDNPGNISKQLLENSQKVKRINLKINSIHLKKLEKMINQMKKRINNQPVIDKNGNIIILAENQKIFSNKISVDNRLFKNNKQDLFVQPSINFIHKRKYKNIRNLLNNKLYTKMKKQVNELLQSAENFLKKGYYFAAQRSLNYAYQTALKTMKLLNKTTKNNNINLKLSIAPEFSRNTGFSGIRTSFGINGFSLFYEYNKLRGHGAGISFKHKF